jgi:hydroxymethylbilane synthase
VYKIGTRGSLLAVTQSTLIKQELEKLSGERFELVLIKTQGDQITDKPLWQLEGKDFFTKELDEALINQEVDLVVHSYKDLGSDRPLPIELAAITERSYAHDILLIKKETVEKLKNWQGEFIVGTSSPRRITNLTEHLPAFLPSHPQVRCETLRGNVNTRIQKLRDGKYHAITLALAGLNRLASFPSSALELSKLLSELTFCVLPQSLFPSAASQGALALEMKVNRNDEGKLKNILQHLHHPQTAEEVQRERAAFKGYGGGCHLAVGIHVRHMHGEYLHFHRGEVDDKKISVKKREGNNIQIKDKNIFFLGQGLAPEKIKDKCITDNFFLKKPLPSSRDLNDKHVFVTSSHTLHALKATFHAASLWSAGIETQKKLVQLGFWVHGSADSMGHEEILKLKNCAALKFMLSDNPWIVLSHNNATSPIGDVLACYEHEMQNLPLEIKQQISQVTHAWWASFPQYQAYIQQIPELKKAQHFCGLGKTYQSFMSAKIPVSPLTDHHEFLSLMEQT